MLINRDVNIIKFKRIVFVSVAMGVSMLWNLEVKDYFWAIIELVTYGVFMYFL